MSVYGSWLYKSYEIWFFINRRIKAPLAGAHCTLLRKSKCEILLQQLENLTVFSGGLCEYSNFYLCLTVSLFPSHTNGFTHGDLPCLWWLLSEMDLKIKLWNHRISLCLIIGKNQMLSLLPLLTKEMKFTGICVAQRDDSGVARINNKGQTAEAFLPQNVTVSILSLLLPSSWVICGWLILAWSFSLEVLFHDTCHSLWFGSLCWMWLRNLKAPELELILRSSVKGVENTCYVISKTKWGIYQLGSKVKTENDQEEIGHEDFSYLNIKQLYECIWKECHCQAMGTFPSKAVLESRGKQRAQFPNDWGHRKWN